VSEKTLRHKLFLAGKAAKAVEKNGEGNGFKYAKAEDVLAEASRVLEKQGIVVFPSVDNVDLKVGRTGCLAIVSMTFEVCDTKGSETLEKTWVGTGWDHPGDKAVYAAITGARKYFMGSLLGIPFGTDPEQNVAPKDAPEESEADQIRAEQDAAAETPDEPKLKPLPKSDFPEPDWSGLALGEEEPANA
jgi:hypothetical protein